MKKVALLTLLVIVATVLIAATPAPTAKKPMCYNWATGKIVPCPFNIKVPKQGEARMEKVGIGLAFVKSSNVWWNYNCSVNGWYGGCGNYYTSMWLYMLPMGCSFRYQY
jgi:hypothetical protein